MGGKIELESAPGVGTTLKFWLSLPVLEAEAAGEAEIDMPALPERRALSAEQAEQEGRLILLVEDHPTNRLVITRQLALAGLVCDTANDGREGLERWRSGRYALVLTDIHMMSMDGYQMAQAIRALEASEGRQRTPILALTAAAVTGEKERCLAAGMDDYRSKPLPLEQMHRWLDTWLPAAPSEPEVEFAAEDVQPAAPDDAEASAPGQAQENELDRRMLAELSGGNSAQERLLMADFLAHCSDDFSQLQDAEQSADFSEVGHQAHRIKGAARLVGALQIAAAADALEHAAGEADRGLVRALMPTLACSLQRMQERYRAQTV